MDIKAILKKHGVEENILETVTTEINSLIPKEFVSKTQYSKKIAQLDEQQNTIADLEAKITNSNNDEFKTKFEEKEKELEEFKANIEKEKINSSKTELLKKSFIEKEMSESVVNLILKGMDLDSLEIEENKIKDFDKIIEGYSEFIPKRENGGAIPPNPPYKINNNQSFTKDQINNMTEKEINANWEVISKSLSNIK